MNGFLITARNEEAKKVILEDLKNTSFQERATMFSIFKRRIIDEGKLLTIDYKLRKAFKKKFNNNMKVASSFSPEDILKEIRNKYADLDLIEDVDFVSGVY